jgi:hypothetical protein
MGVHYARELSGHRSDRYIWRHVSPNAQSLAEAVEEVLHRLKTLRLRSFSS